MKKKLLALLVVGIMVVGLTACDLQVLGKWRIVEVAAGDVVMDQNDISEMGIDVGYIKLNKSGSCKIDMLGDEYDGTWTATGEGANPSNTINLVYGANMQATATFDNNKVMTIKDSQGAVYTLTK